MSYNDVWRNLKYTSSNYCTYKIIFSQHVHWKPWARLMCLMEMALNFPPLPNTNLANGFQITMGPQEHHRTLLPRNFPGQWNRGLQGLFFFLNKTCFGKTVSSACPKGWKPMKLKNCLPPSKRQIQLLSIPCRLHVPAEAHTSARASQQHRDKDQIMFLDRREA